MRTWEMKKKKKNDVKETNVLWKEKSQNHILDINL